MANTLDDFVSSVSQDLKAYSEFAEFKLPHWNFIAPFINFEDEANLDKAKRLFTEDFSSELLINLLAVHNAGKNRSITVKYHGSLAEEKSIKLFDLSGSDPVLIVNKNSDFVIHVSDLNKGPGIIVIFWDF